jgi:hypothetical protein
MKPSERLGILEKIGSTLQARYTFHEIDEYLGTIGIETPETFPVNSKRIYAKTVLAKASDKVLAEIAEDLGLGGSLAAVVARADPPAAWAGSTHFRLFVSHVSKDKAIAMRLKDCLAPYGVRAFVAHEDIEPTRAWEVEIERALHCMDALVAVHTEGFSKSNWTQQEVGFALGRGVKVISFKMGEDPTGFLAKHQALSRQKRTAEDIAKEIVGLLEAAPSTTHRMAEARLASLDDEIPF